MLDIVASYQRMQFPGNLMIETLENGEKPHFGPDLGPLGPNSCREFFFLNLASSFTRYHGQLSSCTTSEKTNHPILRKLSDRRNYRETERKFCP